MKSYRTVYYCLIGGGGGKFFFSVPLHGAGFTHSENSIPLSEEICQHAGYRDAPSGRHSNSHFTLAVANCSFLIVNCSLLIPHC
jgi:hypothetical protein